MDALGAAILAVFIGTYIIISTEKINRTRMALLGMEFGNSGHIISVFVLDWIDVLVDDSPNEVDPAIVLPS